MKPSTLTIQQKITGLLLGYFIIAFVAIASTLFVSGRLEGGAAAINDAGSERMRAYQIGFLLSQYINDPSQQLISEINDSVIAFEQILIALEQGDPGRPLLLPKKQEIRLLLKQIQKTWNIQNKVLIRTILDEPDKNKAEQLLRNYMGELKIFVSSIDNLVVMIEESQSKATKLLRSFQTGLISLAFFGTILLISFFMKMVIKPVKQLKQGLDRMGAGDFDVRLPVSSNDELGALAIGFNQMVKQLQELYGTLEQRISNKTRSLESKSRELVALYDTASFLNSSSVPKELCEGVLTKMVTLLNAQAGVVRLVDHKDEGIPIIASQGVSEEFLSLENQLHCGDCLCGDSATNPSSVSYTVDQIKEQFISDQTCKREGFESVVSVSIESPKGVLGVLNLFFQDVRILPPSELRLLETVSQHLGAAIDNNLFVAREKEMAISEERNLLAQELHDSIAQSLAFLNIQAQLLQDWLSKGNVQQVDKTLMQIKEGIQESYDDVRELLVYFRTRIKHDDIDTAIRDALEKFEGQTGITTNYEFDGNTITLAPETILQFLHIVHECLSNIRKHSQATQVDVNLSYTHGSECQLIIHDNGVGFDNTLDTGETHVGLRIMKERTHRINGVLMVDSAPNEGTTVCLTLPLSTQNLVKEVSAA